MKTFSLPRHCIGGTRLPLDGKSSFVTMVMTIQNKIEKWEKEKVGKW